MAITLNTRCVQHGLSGTDKTFQTLIDTCASPPPTPGKLSSWTDDYDGEACEIKYYSVTLSLTGIDIPFNRDFGAYNCRINAYTPAGETLTAGPTNLQQMVTNMNNSVLTMTLRNIPEGSRIGIMSGNGWYADDRGRNMVADCNIVHPLTGERVGIFEITENIVLWAQVQGIDGGGGGGLLPGRPT